MTRAQRKAKRLTAEAASLLQTDRARSAELYREATALDPALHEAWFDLGLNPDGKGFPG